MQIVGMNAGIAAQDEGKTSPRLVKAAHEFEGQMMKELLKPMTAGGDDADDDAGGSGGALGDFAAEALGQGLSQRGGFGIADRIVKELSQRGKGSHVGKVTGSQHGDTAIRSQK